MKGDLDAIRGAIATLEGLRPSDNQRLMLANAKAKYDLELLRTTEALARCERLVREQSPGATPSPPPGVAASVAPQAVVVAPAVVAAPAPAAAAPEASATPATPCLTGCGKDTDCKGARICVNGACQDPPSR